MRILQWLFENDKFKYILRYKLGQWLMIKCLENKDISHWDATNVTIADGEFSGSTEFKHDLSKWS